MKLNNVSDVYSVNKTEHHIMTVMKCIQHCEKQVKPGCKDPADCFRKGNATLIGAIRNTVAYLYVKHMY